MDLKQVILPSRSLSNVSAVVHSVAGPVPFTVTADTRKEYSVPRSRPRPTTYVALDPKLGYSDCGVVKLNLKEQQLEFTGVSTWLVKWGVAKHNTYFE